MSCLPVDPIHSQQAIDTELGYPPGLDSPGYNICLTHRNGEVNLLMVYELSFYLCYAHYWRIRVIIRMTSA